MHEAVFYGLLVAVMITDDVLQLRYILKRDSLTGIGRPVHFGGSGICEEKISGCETAVNKQRGVTYLLSAGTAGMAWAGADDCSRSAALRLRLGSAAVTGGACGFASCVLWK